MNHHVPDFGIVEDDPVAFAFGFPSRKTAPDSAGDDDLAEILWQKGPVLRRFPPPDDLPTRADFAGRSATDKGSSAGADEGPAELFMGEDDMASWLHCFRNNAVGGSAADSGALCAALEQRRPAVPPLLTEAAARSSLPPLPRMASASRASTVVESNMTPEINLPSLPSIVTATTFERSEAPRASEKGSASSSAGSGEQDVDRDQDRKRKPHDSDDSDGEDADSESDEKKKEIRKPVKKSRAAEVHNLSERKRRDRINEKMKALQQLIPRCNKSDKASMLDDAVEYLKSLQLQIQMMSMGCAMTPVMFPGVQQYMRPIGMPIRMGMDASRWSKAGHPILPFPPVIQGSSIPAPAAAHLGGRVPIQGFHPPTMAVNGQIGAQVAGQQDPTTNLICLQGPNPVQVLNVPNPYQQYFAAYQMQLPQQQTQSTMEPSTSKGSSMPE